MAKLFTNDKGERHPPPYKALNLLTSEQIVQRAAKEVRNGERVYLGQDLASKVRHYLPPNVDVVSDQYEKVNVDVAIIAAIKVSKSGNSILTSTNNGGGRIGWIDIPIFGSRRTIILITLQSNDRTDVFIDDSDQNGESNVSLRQGRIITNFAVFDIEYNKIILREVAPGISAYEIQQQTKIPLLAGPDLCAIEI